MPFFVLFSFPGFGYDTHPLGILFSTHYTPVVARNGDLTQD
jgi:hypothetical protein